jgi:hypothetical protein
MSKNDFILEKGYFHIITGPNGTGKSRMLTKHSELTLEKIKKEDKTYSKMICLAGTVYERFKVPSQDQFNYNYCYLGQKTNNNMFSELAPYRNLFKVFFQDYNNETTYNEKCEVINKLFKQVGFDGFIGVKLRKTRVKKENKKNMNEDKKKEENNKFHRIFFSKEKIFNSSISSLQKALLGNKYFISDITFKKGKNEYNLNDLSSGERSILLMILGLTLIIEDDCIIFYDEPENSMHPKWQEEIMSFLQKIVKLSSNITVVIATHSPLVVSNVTVSNKKIITLGEEDSDWKNYSNNSNIEDTLYKVFNKITPKSYLLSVEISKIVKAMLDGQISKIDAINKLDSFKSAGIDRIQKKVIDNVIYNLDFIKNKLNTEKANYE